MRCPLTAIRHPHTARAAVTLEHTVGGRSRDAESGDGPFALDYFDDGALRAAASGVVKKMWPGW
jgi:hypothetical protein